MNRESEKRLVPPIFASSDPAPQIFRTITELETYAEAVDVENGEWHGYDAVGTPVVLTVSANTVKAMPGSGLAPQELADWLRSDRFLRSRRDEQWLNHASVADLVAAFDLEEKAWQEQRPLSRFWRWLSTGMGGR